MKFLITSKGYPIIADQAFMDAHYPGDYTVLPDDVVPAMVPQEITMRQARRVLQTGGYTATINAIIAAMPSLQKEAAQIDWEYSNTVQRHNGLVANFGPALGLTEAQIDALFVAAAAIP